MSTMFYSKLKDEIAYFLGSPVADWDAKTSDAVESCIRTGVDRVIHNGAHQWSWMRPRLALSTAANQRRYTLPGNFEQFIPSALCYDGEHYTYPVVTQLAGGRLLQLESECVTTGTPAWFAIESDAHDGVTEQDQKLVLHPTPDANYELFGIYQIGVRPLSDAQPYPPGGEAHGELFLASCLAVAEAKFLDAQSEKAEMFKEMMQAHIAIDMRRQPRNLGPLSAKKIPMTGRASLRRVLDLEGGYTTIRGSTNF